MVITDFLSEVLTLILKKKRERERILGYFMRLNERWVK